MKRNDSFTSFRKVRNNNRTVDRRAQLSLEDIPMYFSLKLLDGSIYPCQNLSHAMAASCKHSKRDGVNSWVPCVRTKDGFYMPDILQLPKLGVKE